MLRNYNLFKKLKDVGWRNREAWLAMNPGKKFLSTYSINTALEPPKDWNVIAKKCSNNPNHQHFGKTVEEILSIWQSGGQRGQNRGASLDTYITSVLGGVPDLPVGDEKLIMKCNQFDKLYQSVLSKLTTYVGSEIWLNSLKLGISVRLDSLFTVNTDTQILIAEWKNTEEISSSGYGQKLLGPASHLANSTANKYTIQTHIYNYILSEYELFERIDNRVFQFTAEHYKTHKESFPYDKLFIEEIVKFTNGINQ